MVVLIMLIGAGLVYWAVGQLYARYWNKGLSVEIRFSSDHAVKGDEIELKPWQTENICHCRIFM